MIASHGKKYVFLGIIVMAISGKTNFAHDEPNLDAKKIVATFLKQSVDNISCKILTGGSDETNIIKCTYQETNYVVKFFNSGTLGKDEIAWTQHASDLGIGPRLYYSDPNEAYMLVEFAKGATFVPKQANNPAAIKNIATSLAKLHNSFAQFAHISDMFARIDIKYKKLNCSNKLKDILEECYSHVNDIAIQLQDIIIPLVPCHNDLNPGNIFIENNHITLIDWGDAALGNPYYDIAAFFILNVIEPENEILFFEQYGSKLTNLWRYMQLYKQVIYFEFALNLLLGVQVNNDELLHKQHIIPVNNLDYYLTLLAERTVNIDSSFLYDMAIASLYKIRAKI